MSPATSKASPQTFVQKAASLAASAMDFFSRDEVVKKQARRDRPDTQPKAEQPAQEQPAQEPVQQEPVQQEPVQQEPVEQEPAPQEQPAAPKAQEQPTEPPAANNQEPQQQAPQDAASRGEARRQSERQPGQKNGTDALDDMMNTQNGGASGRPKVQTRTRSPRTSGRSSGEPSANQAAWDGTGSSNAKSRSPIVRFFERHFAMTATQRDRLVGVGPQTKGAPDAPQIGRPRATTSSYEGRHRPETSKKWAARASYGYDFEQLASIVVRRAVPNANDESGKAHGAYLNMVQKAGAAVNENGRPVADKAVEFANLKLVAYLRKKQLGDKADRKQQAQWNCALITALNDRVGETPNKASKEQLRTAFQEACYRFADNMVASRDKAQAEPAAHANDAGSASLVG